MPGFQSGVVGAGEQLDEDAQSGHPAEGSIVRLTARLHESDVEEIKRLARDKDISPTQVLRQAIAAAAFFHDEKLAGSMILVKRKQGEKDVLREVVFG